MEITTEIRKQLDEQKKNCIFCKIVSGEMASERVYFDDGAFAILDINPCVKGHMVIFPKEHYPLPAYMPGPEFAHLFAKTAKLVGAAKKAMLTTGVNVFIASGGAAGQQAPHFMYHILPREVGDGMDKYGFSEDKGVDPNVIGQLRGMLAKNVPLMMRNHFGRNPAKWHQEGRVNLPAYLESAKSRMVYGDEKCIVCMPEVPQAIGHLVIYSTEEEKLFENISEESSSHLFFAASLASTAIFEGLGAHGTNIILKSGESGDNPTGKLEIHILARTQNDGFDLNWTAMNPKPNLKDIRAKISDETFVIEHQNKEKASSPKVVDLDAQIISETKEVKKSAPAGRKTSFATAAEEIEFAMQQIRGD
jgi:histidine triad (HIT) family protein